MGERKEGEIEGLGSVEDDDGGGTGAAFCFVFEDSNLKFAVAS